MATDVCCNFELHATEIPIACDLDAISASDRARYNELRAMLAAAAAGKRELPDGIAIKIATDRMTLAQLAEWISHERKCCPFMDFRIEVGSNSGPVWLSLTGRLGVKEFLSHALTR
ncbi:MAG TPA: hypothetical protein VGR40_10985 [Candidatus Binatus sp.]|nr:hypothetical protein [Candidatus Binatus sp.]